MSTAAEKISPPSELALDNAARLALFDVLSEATIAGYNAISMDEVFDRVIGRLRVLVPRELFTTGERSYVEDKVKISVEAGVLMQTSEGLYALAPDPQIWIRYPDDRIRPYTPGLIAAREQLDSVNNALRDRFDVTKHVPHHRRSSPEFRALVRSMEEHGFLKQGAIYRFADGTYVDGKARFEAAAKAGVEPKWLELKKQDPESTRMRRRDSPLTRVLLALDGNATRLTQEQRQNVLDAAAATAGRSWDEIEVALQLTREWRRAFASRSYTPTFDVQEIPFDGNGGRNVQITPDHKVHVTSLLRASGLAKHKFDTELKDSVPFEMARSKGGGPAAVFVAAADMADGLEAMIDDRREGGRKVSPEWETALDWLRDYQRKHELSCNGG